MTTSDLSGFKCLGCGNCCRQEGYVRLQNNEPDKIARFLNMPVHEFIEKFTRLTRDRQALSLTEKADGDCIFLSDNRCRIQPVKPVQCLEFPYKWKFKDFKKICRWAQNARTPSSG